MSDAERLHSERCTPKNYDLYAVRTVVATMLLVLSFQAKSCVLPPEGMYQSTRELVESTEQIVIATVVNYGRPNSQQLRTFSFASAEAVKGVPPKTFDLRGYLSAEINSAPGDFEEHLDPRFWAYDAGNTIAPGDCQTYGIYKPGGRYLVFLRPQGHFRSYEEIAGESDLWLRVVRTLVDDEADADGN